MLPSTFEQLDRQTREGASKLVRYTKAEVDRLRRDEGVVGVVYVYASSSGYWFARKDNMKALGKWILAYAECGKIFFSEEGMKHAGLSLS